MLPYENVSYTYSIFRKIRTYANVFYFSVRVYSSHGGHPLDPPLSEERTAKKSLVDPASSVPYCISRCLARSSADSIGVSMRSIVRKAARLAVYDEMIMSVKNHQALPTIRPDNDLSHNPSSTSVKAGVMVV